MTSKPLTILDVDGVPEVTIPAVNKNIAAIVKYIVHGCQCNRSNSSLCCCAYWRQGASGAFDVRSIPGFQSPATNGLYYGPHWRALVTSTESRDDVFRALCLLKTTIPVEDMKLPPRVDPNQFFASAAFDSDQGCPLVDNPPSTQTRYLIMLAELSHLHYLEDKASTFQNCECWHKVLRQCEIVNTRLFHLQKQVSRWLSIFLRYDADTCSAILEDDHHYETLASFWGPLKQLIEATHARFQLCAQRLGIVLEQQAGDESSVIPWHLIRRPAIEYYGSHWVHYLANVNDESFLNSLDDFWRGLYKPLYANYHLSPSYPPPLECSGCVNAEAYIAQVRRGDPILFAELEGMDTDFTAVSMTQARYLHFAAELRRSSILVEQFKSNRQRGVGVKLLQCIRSVQFKYGILYDNFIRALKSETCLGSYFNRKESVSCLQALFMELKVLEDFVFGRDFHSEMSGVVHFIESNNSTARLVETCYHSQHLDQISAHSCSSTIKGEGLFFGPQWRQIIQERSPYSLAVALIHLNSLSKEELKLPPCCHPNDILKSDSLGLRSAGYYLIDNPPTTQARYLLVKAELTSIRNQRAQAIELQEDKAWARALNIWHEINNRLFVMKRRMEPWLDIFLTALQRQKQRKGKRTTKDTVELEDNHVYGVLESFWPELRQLILETDRGRQECADRLGLPVMGFGLPIGEAKAAIVPWHLVWKPKMLYYGRYWYTYIQQSTCEFFLDWLIGSFSKLNQAYYVDSLGPPMFPPPRECSECVNIDDYEQLVRKMDDDLFNGYEGKLKLESAQYPIRYIVAFAELRLMALYIQKACRCRKEGKLADATTFRTKVTDLLEGWSGITWGEIVDNTDDSPDSKMLLYLNEQHWYDSLVCMINDFDRIELSLTLVEEIFAGEQGSGDSEGSSKKKKRKKCRSKTKKLTSSSGDLSDSSHGIDIASSSMESQPVASKSSDSADLILNELADEFFKSAVSAPNLQSQRPQKSSLDSKVKASCVAEAKSAGEDLVGGTNSSSKAPAKLDAPICDRPRNSLLQTVPLLRQYECPICLEPMACAVSLHPCGDSFCYQCIVRYLSNAKERTCPYCQTAGVNLASSLPNRMADSTVREILQQLGSEGAEQLAIWERRVGEGVEARKMMAIDTSRNSSGSAPVSSSDTSKKKKKNKKKSDAKSRKP